MNVIFIVGSYYIRTRESPGALTPPELGDYPSLAALRVPGAVGTGSTACHTPTLVVEHPTATYLRTRAVHFPATSCNKSTDQCSLSTPHAT